VVVAGVRPINAAQVLEAVGRLVRKGLFVGGEVEGIYITVAAILNSTKALLVPPPPHPPTSLCFSSAGVCVAPCPCIDASALADDGHRNRYGHRYGHRLNI